MLEKGKEFTYKGKILKIKKYIKPMRAYLADYNGEEIYIHQKTIDKYCEERGE
ncbi:MAG: hypothetical protein ACOC1K_01765 [Nanoarchaeota archaeon]